MNKRHPTLVNICLLHKKSMNYLFKSWKSANKFIKFIVQCGYIDPESNPYFYPRNPNLKSIHEFTFLHW